MTRRIYYNIYFVFVEHSLSVLKKYWWHKSVLQHISKYDILQTINRCRKYSHFIQILCLVAALSIVFTPILGTCYENVGGNFQILIQLVVCVPPLYCIFCSLWLCQIKWVYVSLENRPEESLSPHKRMFSDRTSVSPVLGWPGMP